MTGSTRADRKAQLIKKVCVEEGKTRLLTSADRTENAVTSSHSLYYHLRSNEWTNSHLQNSPKWLRPYLLIWNVPHLLHADRAQAASVWWAGAPPATSYKARIRRSILLVGKTSSILSHLSQKGVWFLGLPVSPQRSGTRQTLLMADRKNWLVSENDHSDGWVGAEGSLERWPKLRVTQVGAELRADGGLTFLTAGASASGIPPSPPTVLSQRLIVDLCVWHDLFIRQRLQWVMRQSSRSETGWGPRWEAGFSPLIDFSVSDTHRPPARVLGKCWQKVELFVPLPHHFFKQAHHASHRAKWVKNTIKSLLGICYPKALCDRKNS